MILLINLRQHSQNIQKNIYISLMIFYKIRKFYLFILRLAACVSKKGKIHPWWSCILLWSGLLANWLTHILESSPFMPLQRFGCYSRYWTCIHCSCLLLLSNLNYDVPSGRSPLNPARTLDLVTSIFKSVLSPVMIFYSISSQTLD